MRLLPLRGEKHSISYRSQWASYFEKEGISYAFYSAATANAIQQARREAAEAQLAAAERGDAENSDEESEEELC